MAKSPKDAAAAAVERIQKEAFEAGLKQGRTEGFEAGWEACASRVTKVLQSPVSVPRTFVSSRQTSEGIYMRFMDSSWPLEITPQAKTFPIDHLGLPVRVYNILLRGFNRQFGHYPSTVGDILDRLTPREVLGLAPEHNSLGDKSVAQLVEALVGIGIEPVYAD